ncbi:MAG: autotransporter adhesin family protein [Kiritimatiellales bacterium]|nr:autotransporter adhesin family protein [Kiritimatiellales bacterium]
MRKERMVGCIAILLGLFAESSFAVNRWTKLDGAWHAPATWGGVSSVPIPKAGDTALVTNNVTVSTATYKDLTLLRIAANNVAGSVTLVPGGVLAPTNDVRIGTSGVGTTPGATLTLDGGDLSTLTIMYAGHTSPGNLVVNSGTLTVGSSLNVARGFDGSIPGSDGSTMTINGGSVSVGFNFRIGVTNQANGFVTISGGSLSVTNGFLLDKGTLTIDGSGSSIWLSKTGPAAWLDFRTDGTLKYIFDATGVSPINFDNKNIKILNGASLAIDGSAFSGAAGTYPLMDFGTYEIAGTNRFTNVSITGFDSYGSATLEYDDANGIINLVVASGAITPATIVGWSTFSTNVMRMVVDAPDAANYYYPKSKPDLMSGTWSNVAHSVDGSDPFIVTNLAYSTAEGTNEVIYVHTDDAKGFFGIGE